MKEIILSVMEYFIGIEGVASMNKLIKIIPFWGRVKTHSPRRPIGFRYCADNRRKSKDIDSHPANINKNTPFWKTLIQVVAAIFIAQLAVGLIVVAMKWLAGGYG